MEVIEEKEVIHTRTKQSIQYPCCYEFSMFFEDDWADFDEITQEFQVIIDAQHMYDPQYRVIRFCPFCGTKIHIENKNEKIIKNRKRYYGVG